MKKRNQTAYDTSLSQFIGGCLIICPKCNEQATVLSFDSENYNLDFTQKKLTCSHCGYNKKFNPAKKGRKISISEGVDPFLGEQLWLTDMVDGNLLWAYNFDHLIFLEDFINAELRERHGQEMSNQSMGSRLPKWMTSKKNRDIVLKSIANLKTKWNERT